MPEVTRVCMLSVHGYFDPVPILGATDTGGQVTYVLELAKALAELGVSVDIYTRRFGGRSEMDPVNRDVRVIRIPCGGDAFIRKEDLFPHLGEYADNMMKHIEAHGLRYDLIHSHYWDAGCVGMNLAERLDLPFIYTAHSLGAWKKERMGGDPVQMEKLFRFTERIHWENEIFRRATAQTVTTLDGKESYKRLYGFESDDLVVIPPGVDVRRFRPEPSVRAPETGAPEDYIFALSRIDSNKGLDYLIRAFDRVARASGTHLIIGGGSKEPKKHEAEVREKLAQLVASLGLEKRVTFTGYIPDEHLDTYYRNARVFVLPSKYEPFGMTVLEAMACGTPVVATGHGGLRHVLTNRRDSLLVDPSDPEGLSSAILEILNDETLASELRAAGLELVESRYSWQSIAAQTLSFYEKYASPRGETL
jgi:mannosylfructose-phosphate synthase